MMEKLKFGNQFGVPALAGFEYSTTPLPQHSATLGAQTLGLPELYTEVQL